LKISTEEVGRIMQAGRLNRTSLIGPKGYGRPVEPRNFASARARSAEAPNPDAEVQRVKALVEALPDVREDLVQALKARVEAGTYHVSSDEIADLMIRRTWADSMR
jgi:flagellar biosynthesis anti-sigma factor FlgM